jgi:hypothetical protein
VFAQWWTSAPSAVTDFSDDFLKARGLSSLEEIPPADLPAYAEGVKAAAKSPQVFTPPPRPAPKPSLPGNPLNLVTGERLA